MPDTSPSYNCRVIASTEVSEAELHAMGLLFSRCYRDADTSYLKKSLGPMRYVAVAENAQAEVLGFCFGDGRLADLPGFDTPQSVAMAGIGCIDESLQRHGLFQQLMMMAMTASGEVNPAEPLLFAGRMAHLITYRILAKMSDSTVPRVGLSPSVWHYQVGEAVAGLFQASLKPKSFVATGSGRPVGYPLVNIQASDDELALFADVQREAGESLLTMGWVNGAPEHW